MTCDVLSLIFLFYFIQILGCHLKRSSCTGCILNYTYAPIYIGDAFSQKNVRIYQDIQATIISVLIGPTAADEACPISSHFYSLFMAAAGVFFRLPDRIFFTLFFIYTYLFFAPCVAIQDSDYDCDLFEQRLCMTWGEIGKDLKLETWCNLATLRLSSSYVFNVASAHPQPGPAGSGTG